jgi:hypothetical protein
MVEIESISSLFLPAPPSVGTACLPVGRGSAGREGGVKTLPFLTGGLLVLGATCSRALCAIFRASIYGLHATYYPHGCLDSKPRRFWHELWREGYYRAP